MPDSANIVLHAYNGARQLFPNSLKWSARALDGRSPSGGQRTLWFDLQGASQILSVPFFDNFGDLYTVVASIKGCEDSAWYPVHVSGSAPVTLDLMFLPEDGAPHFANATWDKLRQTRPGMAAIVQRGCENATAASDKYAQILESRLFSQYHDRAGGDATSIRQVAAGLLLEYRLAAGRCARPELACSA